jgi:hypothetical protein
MIKIYKKVIVTEPFVNWTPGASGSSVTLNIPAIYVRDVLWLGVGTALVYGENYSNFYATRGWSEFKEYIKTVKGMIDIDSTDSYQNDNNGNGLNSGFGGGY